MNNAVGFSHIYEP